MGLCDDIRLDRLVTEREDLHVSREDCRSWLRDAGCPPKRTRALELIRKLYAVEAKVSDSFPGDAQAQERRLKIRQEESGKILEEIRAWCQAQLTLPRSGLGQAIGYVMARWPGLTLFREDPRVSLDNNAAERSLRGPVVGRKNHYGSKSQSRTEVAALFYTLCETAKLRAVDPKAYLRRALLAAIAAPGAVTLPE